MIDTVKIFTLVEPNLYDYMSRKMVVRMAVDRSQNDFVLYEFSSGQVPSYSTSISVSFAEPTKFSLPSKFWNKKILCLECSWHKVSKGQNAYGGFYNFRQIVTEIVTKTEDYFCIDLPDICDWYCLKVDIAVCKDLGYNKEVAKYINSLSRCNYPRRKVRFFTDECLYVSGTTTTLKIYNKLLEFKKNDLKKLSDRSDFNVFEHCKKIEGFVRFECSVKKKKINDIFKDYVSADIKYVSCEHIAYDFLYNVWSDEFMKLLKLVDSGFEKVWKRDDVQNRLLETYGNTKGSNLYSFYICLLVDGYEKIKKVSKKSAFYDKIRSLRLAGVDFSRGIENCEVNLDVLDNSSDLTFDSNYMFDFFKLPEVI